MLYRLELCRRVCFAQSVFFSFRAPQNGNFFVASDEENKELYKSSRVAKLVPLIGGGDGGDDDERRACFQRRRRRRARREKRKSLVWRPLVVSVGWHHVRKLD